MEHLFTTLNSDRLASFIQGACRFVAYAGPGIQQSTAKALVAVAERLGPDAVDLCVDFDERVMRMGYGDVAALDHVRRIGISIRSSSGLRTGLVIADEEGFIFTPTALYLEKEPAGAGALNAMVLSREAVAEVLARLSPRAKEEAQRIAPDPEQREHLFALPTEVPAVVIDAAQFAEVQQRLREVPPVSFDVARQVRVFEPYLQYVEMSLTGAALQRHRIAMPPAIMKLGGGKELEGRLRTTFDLIERSGSLSSKQLESELNEIRNDLTVTLGKTHGRVVLKKNKDLLNKRLDTLREKLKAHQDRVVVELDNLVEKTKEEVVNYYSPIVKRDVPDALTGRLLVATPTDDHIRDWLRAELNKVFPSADKLVSKMMLDVHFKDVTYETLNRSDFEDALRKEFKMMDWDKAYEEYKAVGETGY